MKRPPVSVGSLRGMGRTAEDKWRPLDASAVYPAKWSIEGVLSHGTDRAAQPWPRTGRRPADWRARRTPRAAGADRPTRARARERLPRRVPALGPRPPAAVAGRPAALVARRARVGPRRPGGPPRRRARRRRRATPAPGRVARPPRAD